MARGAPVAAQRHALGVLPLTLVPECPTEAGIGAVSHHDVTGSHLAGMAVLRLGRYAGTAQRRPFHYGLDCLGVLPEGCPALGSVAGDKAVEVLAGHHVAVGRQALYYRPGHYKASPEAMGAQALDAMAGCQLGPQAHVLQLAHRARRQAVPTCLFPRESLPLHQHHVVARLGKPVGTG